jgi:hypothetical protein
MAYDLDLANRIREYIGTQSGVTEQPMFGGLAFLIDGNMSASASRLGGLLLHVDPAQTEKLATRAHAHRLERRGREVLGWVRVDAEGVRTKRDLARWVGLSVSYARSLRPK